MNKLNRIKIDCKACENSKCFIKLCNPDYISLLSDRKNQIVLGRDQYVFQEGTPVFGIYFIQEGKVKIVSSNFEGKAQIVRLANKGHLLGHRGFGNETYPIGAIAMDDTRVCFIDNNTLYDAFKANFDLTYAILMFYSKELRKSEIRTKYFAQMKVDEKVIFALVYIIETFGLDSPKKYINAILSRKEIANIAGTNSDQVSRTIASLKKQNYINTVGNKIFVEDYQNLKSLITSHAPEMI